MRTKGETDATEKTNRGKDKGNERDGVCCNNSMLFMITKTREELQP